LALAFWASSLGTAVLALSLSLWGAIGSLGLLFLAFWLLVFRVLVVLGVTLSLVATFTVASAASLVWNIVEIVWTASLANFGLVDWLLVTSGLSVLGGSQREDNLEASEFAGDSHVIELLVLEFFERLVHVVQEDSLDLVNLMNSGDAMLDDLGDGDSLGDGCTERAQSNFLGLLLVEAGEDLVNEELGRTLAIDTNNLVNLTVAFGAHFLELF